MNKILVLLVIFFCSITSAFALLRDEIIEESLVGKKLSKPTTNLNYNYEAIEKISIKINITEPISTKTGDVFEGQELKFKVKENVFLNHQLFIQQGTIITARIETIVERGMNGLPATLIMQERDLTIPHTQ